AAGVPLALGGVAALRRRASLCRGARARLPGRPPLLPVLRHLPSGRAARPRQAQGLVQAPPPRRRRLSPRRTSSAETEHVADRREAEVAKHAVELRFGAAEPDVVGAEAAAAGGPHARLLGIDFPRVDEDDRGLPL